MNELAIPNNLRKWFDVHALIDVGVALPLMANPNLLKNLGWDEVDPAASRLVAAALLAIAYSSHQASKNQSVEQFVSLLNFKLIWSFTATVGLVISAYTGPKEKKTALYSFAAVFASFFGLWSYYRTQLA